MTHGTVIWNELNTRDPATAKRFFAETIGWTFEDMPIEGGATYGIIMNGDQRVGGMFTMADPVFDGVPDHWLTYLGVDDVDRRVADAEKTGATIMRPPWTIEGVGRMALLRVPGGAVMSWMTPHAPQQP